MSDSPDTPPKRLRFEAPSEVRFFCSTARPAYRLEDGGFQGVNLGQICGVTEMVTNMYLRACHPSEPGGNIEAALHSLGCPRPSPPTCAAREIPISISLPCGDGGWAAAGFQLEGQRCTRRHSWSAWPV